jgi:hypothetical protein
VIAGVLVTAVIASLLFPAAAESHPPVAHDPLQPPAGRSSPGIPPDEQ